MDTSTLVVDSTNNRVGIGTTTAQYALQVNDGSAAVGFAVTNAGSTTVSTLTVSGNGSATVGGDLKVDTSTLVVDSTNNRVGIGTTTPQYTLQVNDGSAAVGLAVNSAGSLTVSTFTATGSATVTGPVLIGTNTPSLGSALYVGSSTAKFRDDNCGIFIYGYNQRKRKSPWYNNGALPC